MSEATSPSGTLYRYSAFTESPAGGNPAGVWVGATLPDPGTMQRIAAEVGYSETAFVATADRPGAAGIASGHALTTRYYSPEAEVSFCGHATVATGVVLGRIAGEGQYVLNTLVGDVPVAVQSANGVTRAALTSVPPKHEPAHPELVGAALTVLGWSVDDLDPAIPPARAYGGAWHLILAAATRERLDRLDYDFDRLKTLMLDDGLTTLQLVWRESDTVFHARNPFPVGGVVEDPATGAAAAALGGYLRDAGLVTVPAELLIRQGEVLGRPSRLTVQIPEDGGIVVSGTAVELPAGT